MLMLLLFVFKIRLSFLEDNLTELTYEMPVGCFITVVFDDLYIFVNLLTLLDMAC